MYDSEAAQMRHQDNKMIKYIPVIKFMQNFYLFFFDCDVRLHRTTTSHHVQQLVTGCLPGDKTLICTCTTSGAPPVEVVSLQSRLQSSFPSNPAHVLQLPGLNLPACLSPPTCLLLCNDWRLIKLITVGVEPTLSDGHFAVEALAKCLWHWGQRSVSELS